MSDDTKTRNRWPNLTACFLNEESKPTVWSLQVAAELDIEERHAEEIAPLQNIIRNLNEFHQGDFHAGEDVDRVVIRLLQEIATLRATMSGMVCKRCYRSDGKMLTASGRAETCPVCQPKEGT